MHALQVDYMHLCHVYRETLSADKTYSIFGLIIFGRKVVAAEKLFCKVQCDNREVQCDNEYRQQQYVHGRYTTCCSFFLFLSSLLNFVFV